MKAYISLAAIAALAVVLQPAHALAARPTLHILRSNAHSEEQVRRATYSARKEAFETFRNEALGFSVQYPKGWKTSYVTAKALADDIVHFAPESNVKSALSVWVKEKSFTPAKADLEKDFLRFSRQPQNDYQVETLAHVHELRVLESGFTHVQGLEAYESVFDAGGTQDPHRYKQVRISAGTHLYVLSFAAPAEAYDAEVHRFDAFIESFKIFAKAPLPPAQNPSRKIAPKRQTR